MMLRLLTDFNEIRDGKITKRISRIADHETLSVSDSVLLHDNGEHEVVGRIVDIDQERVLFEIVWSTWGPDGHITTATADIEGNDDDMPLIRGEELLLTPA
jgi:hypothetical protein